MEAPVHLDWTSINERMPDIAAYPESSNFLIAWEQQYSSTTGPYGIRARVLDATNVLGRVYIPRDSTIGETLACSSPVVAGGGGDWMVVWEHPRDDTPSYRDIHGRILKDRDLLGWFRVVRHLGVVVVGAVAGVASLASEYKL